MNLLYYGDNLDVLRQDSRGNVYTGEVEDGKRIQKFVPVNNRQTDAR